MFKVLFNPRNIIQHLFISFQKYKEYEKSVRIEEIDGAKLVKNLALNMEEIFRKKAEATRVSNLRGKQLNMFACTTSVLFLDEYP